MRSIDLIIQDELHTITDNIGSVYGLYETTIEFLATQSGGRPKYIAATATVRDVDRQTRQLYGGRLAAVFPPTGFDAGDTYFSKDEAPTEGNPGRAYVGIYAPTKSRLTTFVAVLSSILSGAFGSMQRFGALEADPYLTVIGYFNTIRDLGSVKSLLADDVPPVLGKLASENAWPARTLKNWEDELTGRIRSGEVPKRLALLSKSFNGEDGCDFMACTNMISVGIDVSRLGTMVVDGQPKSTAEYIQATSRVGRSSPGVVFVVYNAMRPRDVSHYEHFYAYHLSYYRYVEGGSVTPFSDGCLQRYMAGAYVAGYRLSDSESGNTAANRFKSDESGKSGPLADAFSARAERFGRHEVTSVVASTDGIIERWGNCEESLRYARLSPPPGVRISNKNLDGARPVIVPPEDRDDDKKVPENRRALFLAPRSMRNVEADVPLRVSNYGE